MSRRLYKMAFRDLYNNRRKAIFALVSIMVGMIAFGTMLFSNELITNEITSTYTSINPSSATLNVDRADERVIELTKGFKKIADYEVKSFHQLRGKDAKGNWKTVELFSATDFEKLTLNKVFPLEGAKNPKKNEMLIERDAKIVANKEVGEHLTIQLPNKQEKRLQISGVINDISVHPATMHNTIYAYVSPETLTSLGLTQNRIDIKLADHPYDREQIVNVSNDYMRMLEKNGYQIKNILIEDTPGVSMHLAEYRTALFLLRTFAFIALVFSCLIMSSLITSILLQLVKQMGILKSFGATRRQIINAYLSMYFIPIILTSMISLPISHVLAQFISERLLRISNISLNSQFVSPLLSIIYLVLTLILPLCIAYPSIRKGTKMSIHTALYGESMINEELNGIFFKNKLARPTRLSVRNAFRKKSRLVLNLLTLTISGICFITILIIMLSVQSTVDTNMETFQYEYRFQTSAKEEKMVKNALSSMKSIADYEMWGSTSGKYLDKGNAQDKSYPIMALPQTSKFIKPDLITGKWLSSKEPSQIVVSHEFINAHPKVRVGDQISLAVQEHEADFTIGGIIKDMSGPTIYMNQSSLNNILSSAKQQRIFQTTIISQLQRRERVKLIHQIEAALLTSGISILQSETKNDAVAILKSHYMPTFQTLLIVIIMVVIVSGFGLASTTNIQTLERIKEIGIMKSFGASKKQVIKLITTESVFIALFSWGLAAILSVPAIYFAAKYFSQVTLEAPLQLSYPSIGISYVLWLLLILIVGRRASKKTAVRAAKMTVKECLLSE
ncbi:ABC transporter permease [Enterococcus hulanensis]|uniref:ABC transporter permease n=1 Tax=Enterococcus hulanensis TaxID=2559929 RepID=UPI0028926135|nr:ABC transporter permease [Enterococcus hulanensis]MDT2661953.1 ABC transporter permease [Enterococcus hulanensis]